MLQLLTGLLPIGEKLVERLIPDPTARAKAMKELKAMEQEKRNSYFHQRT
jgi:hypothetical protein